MKQEFGLELVQTQKLALTPELRQAITILQMTSQELLEYVREEAEKNPMLEAVDEDDTALSKEAVDEVLDDDWIMYFVDASDPGVTQRASLSSKDDVTVLYENAVIPGTSLREHLIDQLVLSQLDGFQRKIAEFVIDSLDDNGYLRSSSAEIARCCGATDEEVERVIVVLQSFDPPGVCARSLRECLHIQAACRGYPHLVMTIIEKHLEDLAAGRYTRIAQECKVPLREVLAARSLILRLDPKPGATYSKSAVSYVIPDVSVKKVAGEFIVMINEGSYPKIRLSSEYKQMISGSDDATREYLVEQFKKAHSLIRGIEQRRLTILRVMECIVKKQRKFFESGPGNLEPMTLRDVARELGIHESTVSRAISNKYVETQYGVVPCKLFFGGKVASHEKDVSIDTVKRLIRDIVKNEDPSNPLSDEHLVMELAKKGIRIARRTVAKYRSCLGIPPSNKRRMC